MSWLRRLLASVLPLREKTPSPDASEGNHSPPVSSADLRALFEVLNTESGRGYRCDNRFTLTRRFLETRRLRVDETLRWLGENGAGCDCEVIFNVEPHLDEREGRS